MNIQALWQRMEQLVLSGQGNKDVLDADGQHVVKVLMRAEGAVLITNNAPLRCGTCGNPVFDGAHRYGNPVCKDCCK